MSFRRVELTVRLGITMSDLGSWSRGIARGRMGAGVHHPATRRRTAGKVTVQSH